MTQTLRDEDRADTAEDRHLINESLASLPRGDNMPTANEITQAEEALAALVERMHRAENERDALRAENQDFRAQLAENERAFEEAARLP